MFYILISLLCSVSVGVLLKYSKQRHIATLQIINWGYLYALGLSIVFFRPSYTLHDLTALAWPLILALWLILPTLFLIQALSLKHVGIAKTDVAQRLSLFITLIFAALVFKESFNTLKIIGSCLAVAAILLTLYKADFRYTTNKELVYPLTVLFGFALVDILFKITAGLPFTALLTIIFAGCLLVSLAINIYLVTIKGDRVERRAVWWGAALGALNFGNIYYYLKAHQAFGSNPSIVFATMNLGVVFLGCVLGVVLFREKLTKINYLGILLALVAVAIITSDKYLAG